MYIINIMSNIKHEKFRRLAKLRGDRIIKDLRLLQNLSNTSNYEYMPDEVRAVFGPIEDGLRAAKQSFYKNEHREIRL